jgi:organic hydroperoxide reductase OsmC/OhrA
VDGHAVRFSVPASMGGKGVGASPETLLISAVTACYSLTLLAIARKRDLPCTEVSVRTEGTVAGFPREETSTRIVVNPVFHRGDAARAAVYRAAAAEARDRCFIGQTVAAGRPAYEVGSSRRGLRRPGAGPAAQLFSQSADSVLKTPSCSSPGAPFCMVSS